MNSYDCSNNLKEESKENKLKNKFDNLKSDYFLEKVFKIMNKKKSLEIIKYNKKIQNRLKINVNSYKEYLEIYSSIELEIIPVLNEYGKFINIEKEEDRKYYHIYFNYDEEEAKRTELYEDENVSKINIIIDYQIISFNKLFYNCKCIESIYFKKFYKNDIKNMNNMFSGCSSLKQLDLSNFNTNNVTDMSFMFSYCSSLKELNLNNFNTYNVTDMRCMFYECTSLKELNINKFNTSNAINMNYMFSACSSLKELNINNFNLNNVANMMHMFYGCSSLKELNFPNFNINKEIKMDRMFSKCSN